MTARSRVCRRRLLQQAMQAYCTFGVDVPPDATYGSLKQANSAYRLAHDALLGLVGPFAAWISSAELHLDAFRVDANSATPCTLIV